ncbi:MAG: bidirectional hydrogenase complex protein HoxE [Gemmataceae bacterium]
MSPVPTKPVAAPAKSDSHPSGDKRFKLLEVAMKRHQFQQHALIEILHKAQELFGYLEPDLLYFIGRHLKLPPSKVYGVATFYNFFSLKPPGKHTCVICTGTACYVKGAEVLLDAVSNEFQVAAEETTEDGQVSLLTARCIGACGIAPAVVLDGTIKGQLTSELLLEDTKGWKTNGSAAAS